MNVLAVISPGLKVFFERVGKPENLNAENLRRLFRSARTAQGVIGKIVRVLTRRSVPSGDDPIAERVL